MATLRVGRQDGKHKGYGERLHCTRLVEKKRIWVERMAFLPNHAVGKLKKAAWHDSSSTIEAEVSFSEARVDKLVIPSTAPSNTKAREQAEESNLLRHVCYLIFSASYAVVTSLSALFGNLAAQN